MLDKNSNGFCMLLYYSHPLRLCKHSTLTHCRNMFCICSVRLRTNRFGHGLAEHATSSQLRDKKTDVQTRCITVNYIIPVSTVWSWHTEADQKCYVHIILVDRFLRFCTIGERQQLLHENYSFKPKKAICTAHFITFWRGHKNHRWQISLSKC